MCYKKVALLVPYTLIIVLIAYSFNFVNEQYDIGLICPTWEFTGLYCAGCGMTRAVLSLAKLDFYQAFRYNAFSLILLPMLFLYFYGEVYAYCFKEKNFIAKKIPTVIWIVLVALMTIYGVLRNIPFFSFLAPICIR